MSENAATNDWLCLSLIPGLGPAGAARLLDRFGSPAKVLGAGAKELAATDGIRSSQLTGFARLPELRELAARQIAGMQKLGGEIVSLVDPRYPDRLREIPDPPLVLYALGDVALMGSHCVAMVGSRSATTYGRRAAWLLAENLTTYGVTVVSGMALGIDSEAHYGALKSEGRTIAVLGSGLDVIYPSQNRTLYDQLRAKGLLLSEYPLGTKPDGFRFPARNRIIAGLSQGVVVVEAARKSGSLITAQMALDFGREIFAVPGQIDSLKSEGAHWLLREGAKLVASGSDIVEELQWGIAANGCSGQQPKGDPYSGLEPDGVALLEQLDAYPLSRDEVCERTGLTPARLSELLLFLELEGHIEMVAGDQVRRLA
ncbi:DNA-processing protein DprA [Desulfopila aestuarii]|nr:DNA-processing protein DprA [Desulfopila aestuarii]